MMGGERGGATASVATRLFTTPPRRLVDWLVDSIEDSTFRTRQERRGVFLDLLGRINRGIIREDFPDRFLRD